MVSDDALNILSLNTKSATDKKFSLAADDALKILGRISKKDQTLMGIPSPKNLIIQRLAVGPPSIRPSIQMPGMHRSEDDLTYCYQAILRTNILLKQNIDRGANQTTVNEMRHMLQYYVATLMDNDIAGQPTHK